MKPTPLSSVKSQHQSKEKLLAAVEQFTKTDLWHAHPHFEGLAHVSNKKLLRLHGLFEDAKKRFGSRQKLVAAILKLDNREKDQGLKSKLEGYPLPRLMDLHAAAERRSKRAEAKAKGDTKPPAKKRARSKKAQAKAAAKG